MTLVKISKWQVDFVALFVPVASGRCHFYIYKEEPNDFKEFYKRNC